MLGPKGVISMSSPMHAKRYSNIILRKKHKAVKKLKNGRNPGPGELEPELSNTCRQNHIAHL